MIRFVVFTNEINDFILPIKKVLNDLTTYNIKNNVIYFEDFDGVIETFKNISNDFFADMVISDCAAKFNEDDVKWLMQLYKASNLKGFVYEREILIKTLDSSIHTKKRVLKKYYNDFEMLNIIKTFLECNMNTSKASSALYVHRNTLINKIDKFFEETGYDLKSFKDSFIIYNLIK